MSLTCDITAVLNVHAEGVLAGPSLVSFNRAIETARQVGLKVEGLVVMDRPDEATRLQFEAVGARYRILEINEGDLGNARNTAVMEANGRFVGFLDGDDLWSANWLVRALRLCLPLPDVTIAHSELNVIFGKERLTYWHPDSRDADFDYDHLRYNNCWLALSFASREVYVRHPYARMDRRQGFGYEDWHWNCITLAAGIDHRPVMDTVHFIRRKKSNSLLALTQAANAIPWVTPLTSYGWRRPHRASQDQEN